MRRTVLEILGGRIGRSDPRTLPAVMEAADDDAAPAVRMDAIATLAALAPGQDVAYQAIVDRVDHDLDDGVRSIALAELANGWAEHPPFLPWVGRIAVEDSNPELRAEAIVIFTEHGEPAALKRAGRTPDR